MRLRSRAALEAGGAIVSGARDKPGNATVQVKPGDLDALSCRCPRFPQCGHGFTLEYFGPGGEHLYRDWLKDDFGAMLTPPPERPWSSPALSFRLAHPP